MLYACNQTTLLVLLTLTPLYFPDSYGTIPTFEHPVPFQGPLFFIEYQQQILNPSF